MPIFLHFLPTTRTNAFPLVLLEAMQAKLPVISTFEGGIPDIVEDGLTGYLIPQKNTEALAEKLEMLITHPDIRHQMGDAAFKKFEREYTFDTFEIRLTEILKKLTSKS
jgi:glycosyltransferase involved in cell wall biosynthesis